VRGAEAAGRLHRILPPNHFTKILLLSSSTKVSHTTRHRRGGERGRCDGRVMMLADAGVWMRGTSLGGEDEEG